jgi:NADH:ubiquinone oxidoreductase subunit
MSATLGTMLLTWLRGQRVGADEFGNRYYRLRGFKPQQLGGGRFSRERRWVMYRGTPEASKVPAEWHAWLHHSVAEPPLQRQRYAWEKPHLPNLTGTPLAYHPQGSVLRGGHRAAATGDYEPWTPE